MDKQEPQVGPEERHARSRIMEWGRTQRYLGELVEDGESFPTGTMRMAPELNGLANFDCCYIQWGLWL
jgi:hypothetical protein